MNRKLRELSILVKDYNNGVKHRIELMARRHTN